MTNSELLSSLTIHAKQDGTWLEFKSSSGKSATLRIESIADEKHSLIGMALNEWCEDQQKRIENEPSAGALKAAKVIWKGKDDSGEIYETAQIIDEETHYKELVEAVNSVTHVANDHNCPFDTWAEGECEACIGEKKQITISVKLRE